MPHSARLRRARQVEVVATDSAGSVYAGTGMGWPPSAGRSEAMGESRPRWPSVVESVQNPVVEKDVSAAQVEAVPAEDGHASWDYHSRASLAHRYVAMTVPKVACTTIKMTLQTWEGCWGGSARGADASGIDGVTLIAERGRL
jgi:hypothetical protein